MQYDPKAETPGLRDRPRMKRRIKRGISLTHTDPSDPVPGLTGEVEGDAPVTGETGFPSPAESPSPRSLTPPPWGPWATTGWTVLAMVVFLGISIGVWIAVTIVVIALGIGDPQNLDVESLAWVDLLAYLVAGPVAVALLLGAIMLRRWSFVRYMALVRCSGLAMGVSLGIGALYLGGEILLNVLLDRPTPEFMINILAHKPTWPVVLLAVVVAAPLVEELVFRGFMYRGLAASRLGVAGAIFITSLIWALIHLQYDWLDVGLIFGLGIVLGLTRHFTGSIWPAIGIHFLLNLTSMALMILYITLGWM